MQKHVSFIPRLSAIITLWLVILVTPAWPQSSATTERPDLKRIFDVSGVNGGIIVYDLHKDISYIYNPVRVRTGYLPASTFKILNSLIALEVGVVKDTKQQLLKGNSEILLFEGKPLLPDECNNSITMQIAFSKSCIQIYQAIAREIGIDRYKKFIGEINYGNANVESASAESFWLSGNFNITAEQQVKFLKEFYLDKLPFSKKTTHQVKELMLIEQTQSYTLRGKTGYSYAATPRIGWFVGWLEHGDDAYIFAMNIDIEKKEQLQYRIKITKESLASLGFYANPQ
jgi:beta-lactamase class D